MIVPAIKANGISIVVCVYGVKLMVYFNISSQ
jgi:hypothetical protein